MKKFENFVIISFVSIAFIVSIVSTIHSISFFQLTNPKWMSITLSVAFEIGQLASLAALINRDKINPKIAWSLFIFLTSFQIATNIYYSFEYLNENSEIHKKYSELFFLSSLNEIAQKRILAFVSGGFLPLLSVGFSKALTNYLTAILNQKNVSNEIIESDSNLEQIVLNDNKEDLNEIVLNENQQNVLIKEKSNRGRKRIDFKKFERDIFRFGDDDFMTRIKVLDKKFIKELGYIKDENFIEKLKDKLIKDENLKKELLKKLKNENKN